MTAVVDADPDPGAPGAEPVRSGRRRWLKPGRRRWLVVAAVLAGFLAAGGITAGVLLLVNDGAAERAAQQQELAEQRAALREYAAGIDQVARAAGAIIEFEMKPAIGEIAEGEGAHHAGVAESWAADLEDLRAGLAEQTPPPGAEPAHEGFLDALDGYVETAGHLAQAAAAEDASVRDRALDETVTRGDRSDRLWNEAREQVEAVLREHGLEVQVG